MEIDKNSALTARAAEMGRAYVTELAAVLNGGELPELFVAMERIRKAFDEGRKLFVAGNGGSAATASHMVCDLQKTTLGPAYASVTKRVRAIALSDNGPLLSAWGNDCGYDQVFAQQLKNLGDPLDVLLVISASGNSPNILETLKAAKEMGLETIGFLGFEGGEAKSLCDVAVVARSDNYGVVEDAHSIFMHLMTQALGEIVRGERE